MNVNMLVKSCLEKIISNIDCGNSNISEEDGIQIIEYINSLTDTKRKLSKYQACSYLNVSRATFDRLVQKGFIPKGKKQVGFKELF